MKKKYKILILIIIGIISILCAITGGILMGFDKVGNFNPTPLGILSIVLGVFGILADIFIFLFWDIDK